MKKNTLRNFHVPLTNDLYSKLRQEAERSNQPATEVARHAIESWLEQRKKAALHDAIVAYATRNAGTAVDLDLALEDASLEHFVAQEEKDL
jgi:predicted transcriptional regulator